MDRRQLVWRAVAGAGGAICAVLVAAVIAALWTPAWFRPPSVAAEARQAVRDDLQASAQAFSDALMVEGVFEVNLEEPQFNQWIAMRKEIYPLIEREMPPSVSEPMVILEPGVIRLAARYDGGGPAVIVSVDLAVRMEPDEIRLTAAAVRVGALRVPLGWLGGLLGHEISLEAGRTWHGSPEIRGNLRDGLHVSARAVWPNGDREYRVLDVRPDVGVIQFGIESLGPAFRSDRKVQR